MADDLKYGYKGAEPTQSFGNNTGVFDPNDINNLIADNKWTSFGQLELIETQTVTSSTTVDFTSIDESTYNVHFLTINNAGTNAGASRYFSVQFFESGVLETASVYQYAHQYGLTNGSFGEAKTTSNPSIIFGEGMTNSANSSSNSYCYFYNLGDSSKYSFMTYQGVSFDGTNMIMNFGSGVLPQASTVDGFRCLLTSDNITNATISLYGIRYS